jgi:hypothetical protein
MVLTLEKPLSSAKTTGEVLRLPCKFIKGETTLDSMAVTAIAQELSITGKNILPVIVKSLKQDKYEAIVNAQVLVAAKQAKLDFVYCIIIEANELEQIQIEIGKALPVVKINLQQSTEMELVTAFESLKKSIPEFAKIEPKKIAKAIIQYRNSKQIANLSFLATLKCGIGKTKLPPLESRFTY